MSDVRQIERTWPKRREFGEVFGAHAVECRGKYTYSVVRQVTGVEYKVVDVFSDKSKAWSLCDRLREAYLCGEQDGRGDWKTPPGQ